MDSLSSILNKVTSASSPSLMFAQYTVTLYDTNSKGQRSNGSCWLLSILTNESEPERQSPGDTYA